MTAGPRDRILVVLPALNEAETVAGVVRDVRAALPGADALVVDDGSADDTPRMARDAGAQVLELPYHLGVGGALRAGFRYARRKGYDTVVQLDADGQHDPQEISRLLDALDRVDGVDIVVGSRFRGRGDYEVGGRARRFGMRALASAVSRVAGRTLTDVTSGFRAVGPDAIDLFARDFPVEWLGDTVESLLVAARHGLVIDEVPVAMRERAGGRPSQNPLQASVYLVRAFLVVLVTRLRRRSSTSARNRKAAES